MSATTEFSGLLVGYGHGTCVDCGKVGLLRRHRCLELVGEQMNALEPRRWACEECSVACFQRTLVGMREGTV